MMPRYIDADEYVIISVVEKTDDDPSEMPITVGDLIKRITKRELHFVDVRENVRGEWIRNSNNMLECSVCHQVKPYDVVADTVTFYDMYYCPNCGADMRGAEK